MSGNFTVMSPEQEERLRKLEAFYKAVGELVKESGAPNYTVNREYLKEELRAVDSNWYNSIGQPRWGAGHGGEG